MEIKGFKTGVLPRHGQKIIFLHCCDYEMSVPVQFIIANVEKQIIEYDEDGDETGNSYTYRPRGSKCANRCDKNDKLYTMAIDCFDCQFEITTKTLWCDYGVFVKRYQNFYK